MKEYMVEYSITVNGQTHNGDTITFDKAQSKRISKKWQKRGYTTVIKRREQASDEWEVVNI